LEQLLKRNLWVHVERNRREDTLAAASGSMGGFLRSLNPFRFKPRWPARIAPKSL
jgi:hypothetical protein